MSIYSNNIVKTPLNVDPQKHNNGGVKMSTFVMKWSFYKQTTEGMVTWDIRIYFSDMSPKWKKITMISTHITLNVGALHLLDHTLIGKCTTLFLLQ